MARGRAFLLALAVAAAVALGPGAARAEACAFFAATWGGDTSPGTGERPFRTIRRLLGALDTGQTGCLLPGSTFRENVVVNKAGVTLRTSPGSRALISGGVIVQDGADNVTLAYVRIRGRGNHKAVVQVYSNGVRLYRTDVTGLDTTNADMHCVLLDGAYGALIEGNEIHNCTRVTSRRLYSAGIVAYDTQDTTIRHNFVYHTVGDGIVLAPRAVRVVVHHNLIDGNVGGIYIGGSSTGNRIRDNIVSYSGRYNVHGNGGRGNLVTGNCLWRGFQGNVRGDGFRAVRNLVTSPRYVNRPQTYRLERGPCFRKRPYPGPLPARRAPAPKPKPPVVRRPPRRAVAPRPRTVLPRFLVQYHLRATRNRVQVVRLGLVGLRTGSAVSIRCLRGCSARQAFYAGRSGRRDFDRVRGRWLRVGSVIEVRSTRRNAIGHWVKVTVTGLPRGVSISHGCLAPGAGSPSPCSRYR